jgi:hypothetical protein
VAALTSSPEPAAGLSNSLPQRVQDAREQLNDLRARYTDAHPLVIQQRLRLASLEAEESQPVPPATESGSAPSAVRPTAPSQAADSRFTPEEVAIGERLRTLEANRELLIERQRAIQPFRENPPGYFRVLQSASSNPTQVLRYRLETVLFACMGALAGFFGSAGLVLLGEFLCNRISTRADVRRVTGLPLLATLGDLGPMSPADQERWAFRAWTAAQGRARRRGRSRQQCMGSRQPEGRRRPHHLGQHARPRRQCGFRGHDHRQLSPKPALTRAPDEAAGRRHRNQKVRLPTPGLIVDRQISEQLEEDCPPVISVALARQGHGVQERRRQLRSALEAWEADRQRGGPRRPPPGLHAADSVLLADDRPEPDLAGRRLPGRRHPDARGPGRRCATRGCNLVGAVFNRESPRPLERPVQPLARQPGAPPGVPRQRDFVAPLLRRTMTRRPHPRRPRRPLSDPIPRSRASVAAEA